MTEPRIYVANLAKYNEGKLVGQWIDVPTDKDELLEAIQAVAPDDDEWAVHDSEGLPKSLQGEHPDLDDLVKFAELCEEHDHEIVMAAIDNFHDLDEAEDQLDNLAGVYPSKEEFAEEFLQETGELANLSKHLRHYFDYAGYVRDLELNGDIWTADVSDGVAVFWNR